MVFKTKVTEMLGIKHPIIAAPMCPFYTKELAVAVFEAGGLGVLSHTNMFGKNSLEEMKKDMDYVIENTINNMVKNAEKRLREASSYIILNYIKYLYCFFSYIL